MEDSNLNNEAINVNRQPRVIDETNYQQFVPRESGPSAVGRGGDAFFRNTNATNEQLVDLLKETSTIQDWTQREQSNKVALGCLEDEDLKDVYFQIKDGFKDYGRILLMGFKTPQGVEIPRLKIYDTQGEVVQVLSGNLAIEEIRRRGEEFNQG